MHTHTHTYACMHTHLHMHAHIHTCMHTYTHTHTHTCMHAPMHEQTHTYTPAASSMYQQQGFSADNVLSRLPCNVSPVLFQVVTRQEERETIRITLSHTKHTRVSDPGLLLLNKLGSAKHFIFTHHVDETPPPSPHRHVRTHTYMHTHPHTCTHIHAHTHTHTHTHTHLSLIHISEPTRLA